MGSTPVTFGATILVVDDIRANVLIIKKILSYV